MTTRKYIEDGYKPFDETDLNLEERDKAVLRKAPEYQPLTVAYVETAIEKMRRYLGEDPPRPQLAHYIEFWLAKKLLREMVGQSITSKGSNYDELAGKILEACKLRPTWITQPTRAGNGTGRR